jgi:hypothetical protein
LKKQQNLGDCTRNVIQKIHGFAGKYLFNDNGVHEIIGRGRWTCGSQIHCSKQAEFENFD